MDDFDVWSQQPSQTLACRLKPTTAPHIQPRQPAAVLPHEKSAAARLSTQLAPLTLEAYLQLHAVLTRGAKTVQQALPGDVSRIKAQDLRQVTGYTSRA